MQKEQATQCPLPGTRGVHLEYVGPGVWRLTGEFNACTVKHEDALWRVVADGHYIGRYTSAGTALSHAYSVASDPVKRLD